ncbi:hypothetical protein E2542_SST06650 [Spatholobus suberectus]|nr:hypothetical protein E2542_SST06650 [Spatholobus suberectus]
MRKLLGSFWTRKHHFHLLFGRPSLGRKPLRDHFKYLSDYVSFYLNSFTDLSDYFLSLCNLLLILVRLLKFAKKGSTDAMEAIGIRSYSYGSFLHFWSHLSLVMK